MRIEYTDEATFITEEIEIPDDQYRVAEKLFQSIRLTSEKNQLLHPCGVIRLRNDKKNLCFNMNEATNYYRITIEKLEWR